MGVGLEPEAETDDVNDAVFNAHRRQSLEAVRRYSNESHAQLLAALRGLSDADLKRPYSFYQPGDPEEMRPVAGWVAGNTYEHYAKHIDWINHLLSESSAAR